MNEPEVNCTGLWRWSAYIHTLDYLVPGFVHGHQTREQWTPNRVHCLTTLWPMAGNIRLLEHYRTDSPESKFPYVRKKYFLQRALSVLLLVFVNKMDIKAKYKTSKECILIRFLVWCNSSLLFAIASSKYFARRRLRSPASSIAEHETTGFTVGLIFQTGKLEQNIHVSKAVCTRSPFPVPTPSAWKASLDNRPSSVPTRHTHNIVRKD